MEDIFTNVRICGLCKNFMAIPTISSEFLRKNNNLLIYNIKNDT